MPDFVVLVVVASAVAVAVFALSARYAERWRAPGWFGLVATFVAAWIAAQVLWDSLWIVDLVPVVPALFLAFGARSVATGVWADRYRKQGRIGELVRQHAVRGDRAGAKSCIDREIGDKRVRKALVQATDELIDLRENLRRVRAARVPPLLADRLAAEAEAAASVVWGTADRLVAAQAFNVPSAVLRPALDGEIDRLRRLVAAIREARLGLAELALAGGGRSDIDRVEARFTALARTARAVREDDLLR